MDFTPFVLSSYGHLTRKARSFIETIASWLCEKWILSFGVAEDYVRRVILASMFGFMGKQMLCAGAGVA